MIPRQQISAAGVLAGLGLVFLMVAGVPTTWILSPLRVFIMAITGVLLAWLVVHTIRRFRQLP